MCDQATPRRAREANMSNAEIQTIQRHQMPTKMAKEVKYQIASLSRADLGSHTYEQTKSHFKDAKNDLSIFDAAGKLILRGREFGDRTFYWSADSKDVRLATM
jgi:hypothetical protein